MKNKKGAKKVCFPGPITIGAILVSKYMIKKYGVDEAFSRTIKKQLKK